MLAAICSIAGEACSHGVPQGVPALSRLDCGFAAWGKKCDWITNLISMDEELTHQYF